MVDRAAGKFPALSADDISKRYTDYDYWLHVWLLTIVLATLHNCSKNAFDGWESAIVGRLKDQRGLVTITTVLNSVLHAGQTDFFSYAMRDYQLRLDPAFRKIDYPAAFFVDNIDEYFESTDEDSQAAASAVMYRNRNRSIAQLAQVALVRAIRDLDGINDHVKVYAAIRREAFIHARKFETLATQLNNKVVMLEYSDNDLHEIFTNNIEMEPSSNLVNANSREPLERFIGAANLKIRSHFTNTVEDFFDFVLRHTLKRPRDLMAIGASISNLAPVDRKDPEKLKAIVFKSARDVVLNYIREMGRFMPPPHDGLFSLIPKNCLTHEDLESVGKEYRELNGYGEAVYSQTPFVALYNLGLLGDIVSDRWGHQVQRFWNPNEIAFDEDERILPNSQYLLVHPALDEYINERHGGDYFSNMETRNIIGHSKPWSSGQLSSYVLRGDLAGYSEIMHDANYSHLYPALLRKWVREACRELDYAELSEGDGLLLIDPSPLRLLAAVRMLHHLTSTFELSKTMRFGAARGPITYEHWTEDNKKASVPLGVAIRIAARLEPLGRQLHQTYCNDSVIVAAGSFIEGLDDASKKEFEVRQISRTEMPDLDVDHEEKFIVIKTERDPPITTRLWSLVIADMR